MPKKDDKPRGAADTVQLKLRMPEALRAQIEASASDSGRSMNAEIVARLEESFRYDGVFTNHIKPALGALAYDAWRIESRTGQRWNDDRATALAIASIAGRVFRFGTPMENSEEIEEAMAQSKNLLDNAKRKVGYLLDVGAIAESPNTGGLLGRYAPKGTLLGSSNSSGVLEDVGDRSLGYTKEWGGVVAFLSSEGFVPRVALGSNVKDWALHRDGQPISFEEKVGTGAVLESLKGIVEEYIEAMEALNVAGLPEERAEAEAQRIVQSLNGEA